jgi:hypothetical protein
MQHNATNAQRTTHKHAEDTHTHTYLLTPVLNLVVASMVCLASRMYPSIPRHTKVVYAAAIAEPLRVPSSEGDTNRPPGLHHTTSCQVVGVSVRSKRKMGCRDGLLPVGKRPELVFAV